MNPLFPLNEYIPDGEPHIFGDRVYLYGSHDKAGGDRFCVQDYTVYSAPIDDLENWTSHGISYKKTQDPRSVGHRTVDYYAPDCVRGNDGRYYLYYFAAGPNTRAFGPLSAAVSESPAGPFEYLGDIRYPDGSPVLDFLTNDPAVINDGGRIFLYYGWGLGRDFSCKMLTPLYNFVLSRLCNRDIRTIKNTKPSILSCAVVELRNDMLTVKSKPRALLDSKTTADKESELYRHPFYEAPSIRKFGELYYLVYSSGENNELAYATSRYPDRDFTYRGVIISGSDLGLNRNKKPKAPSGTIHGGIECINGSYYIFYHRCTNDTDFSRQACAERIEISPDGTIAQVELTTSGAGDALLTKGAYSASLCCQLYNERRKDRRGKRAMITEREAVSYVARIGDGTVLGYKYFDFCATSSLTVRLRGGGARVEVYAGDNAIGKASFVGSKDFCKLRIEIKELTGRYPLYFKFYGAKGVEMLDFCFNGEEKK